MTKARVVVLAVLASAFAMATSPAGAIDVGGPFHHQTVRVTVPGEITALTVTNDVGNVTVVPGEVAGIVAYEQYNFQAPKLVHTLRDGVLHVAAPCPRTTGVVDLGLNNCAADLVITVPQAVTVNAHDSVGDIRIRDLRGIETVHTDDGDVLLDGVAASKLTVTSDTGTVRLANVRSDALTLRNADGDIRADLATMPHSLVARNDTGDVDLVVPAGIYALDLHSDDGSTHVTGITAHSDASRTLSAHTSDGDIRITGR